MFDLRCPSFMSTDRNLSPAKPVVTALIDTYNYGHFVEQAIDSVLAQDYPSERVEILVVDDGSTDDTAERVKKYGTRIQYHYKPNGGQASALNFGFERATGEIIAFLDADDYWLPGKLTRVVRIFEELPEVGMVYHRLMDLDSTTGKFTDGSFVQCSGNLPDNMKSLLDYRVPPTSSLSFSRHVLAGMLPMPERIRLQADAYLALLVVFLAPVVAIPEHLSVYRLHGKNLYASGIHVSEKMPEQLGMWHQILVAATKWLSDHKFDLSRADIETFFEQWFFFVATNEFEIKPPTRRQFFRHMLRQTKLYWSHDGWKLRTMNMLNTIAAPLVGYQKFPAMYKTELRFIASLQRFRSRRV